MLFLKNVLEILHVSIITRYSRARHGGPEGVDASGTAMSIGHHRPTSTRIHVTMTVIWTECSTDLTTLEVRRT